MGGGGGSRPRLRSDGSMRAPPGRRSGQTIRPVFRALAALSRRGPYDVTPGATLRRENYPNLRENTTKTL